MTGFVSVMIMIDVIAVVGAAFMWFIILALRLVY